MSQLRKLFRWMREAAPHRSIIGQIRDIVETKIRVNLGPRAYYTFGFYKAGMSWEQKSRFVSNRGCRYWVFGNNSFKYLILFTDKYVQKAMLTGCGLPTPPLLGLVGGDSGIDSFEDFRRMVDAGPDEFVLKPASSRGGVGFQKVSKVEGSSGTGIGPAELDRLWDELQPFIERGVLMEETVVNEPGIRRLNPSSLNTFRVITFRLPGKGWVPICINLKVGRAGSTVDNTGAGGLVVRVESEGRTGSAIDFESGMEYTEHPDNGAQLSGVVIDRLDDVRQLAVDASCHFPHMGILGWDIALTSAGPLIIEVNASPSVDYPQIVYGGLVSDEMAAVLKRRHMFSRYPRTHMYPNFLVSQTRLV